MIPPAPPQTPAPASPLQTPAPPPAVMPPAPVRRRSMWIWLGPLTGVLVVGCILAMVAFVRFAGNAADAGGVRATNEIPRTAIERLEKRHLLDPGETVLAYYDATIAGDGSEVAMVTTERLVYFNAGRSTALRLADVVDVRHHTEPLIGDVIEAQGDSGLTIKVEVAPLNNGDFFLSALQTAWKKKRPAAGSVTPPAAP